MKTQLQREGWNHCLGFTFNQIINLKEKNVIASLILWTLQRKSKIFKLRHWIKQMKNFYIEKCNRLFNFNWYEHCSSDQSKIASNMEYRLLWMNVRHAILNGRLNAMLRKAQENLSTTQHTNMNNEFDRFWKSKNCDTHYLLFILNSIWKWVWISLSAMTTRNTNSYRWFLSPRLKSIL